VSRGLGLGGVALLVVACATAPPPRGVPSSGGAPGLAPTPRSVEALAAAVAADSLRSDAEPDAKVRGGLAADAGRDADACLAIDPRSAVCLYYHGVALGLEARAHPLHAADLLKTMLEALAAADAVDAEYDNAGPSRVRALVLIRAPQWPLGPGDPDAGLVAARRAVSLRPKYPANVLALAEALAKTGDAQGARESYTHARDLAQALPGSSDRDQWLREANKALQRN
jgi:hypothetical protein